jgi:hypothetical protein
MGDVSVRLGSAGCFWAPSTSLQLQPQADASSSHCSPRLYPLAPTRDVVEGQQRVRQVLHNERHPQHRRAVQQRQLPDQACIWGLPLLGLMQGAGGGGSGGGEGCQGDGWVQTSLTAR